MLREPWIMKTFKNRFEEDDIPPDSFINITRADFFEQNIIQSEKPVLLLCIHSGTELTGQLALLKELSVSYDETIAVHILAVEFVPAFMERFGVTGTPTFFIFDKGEEKGRLLGHADLARLNQFLAKHLIFNKRRVPFQE
jgi:thioredoxin-like negative regulator of GroEL